MNLLTIRPAHAVFSLTVVVSAFLAAPETAYSQPAQNRSITAEVEEAEGGPDGVITVSPSLSPAPVNTADVWEDRGERYRAGGREIKVLRSSRKWALHYDGLLPDSGSFRKRLKDRGLDARVADGVGPGSRRLRVVTAGPGVSTETARARSRDIASAEAGAVLRPIYIDAATRTEFTVTERVLVRTRGPSTAASRRALAGSVGADVVGTRSGDVVILRLRNRAGDPFGAAASLSRRSDVMWAEPEFLSQPKRSFTPSDPLFSRQQHLNNTGQQGGVSGADINAPEAWDITRGDSSVIIAVLDDGVQLNHPDLRIAPGGKNFITDPPTDNPDGHIGDSANWHGTAVAGIAAARGDNATGVSGVAPNARILPIKIFHGLGLTVYASQLQISDAIRYAADAGAHVINNSWYFNPFNNDINDAITYASTQGRGGKGALVFNATGNFGDGFSEFNLAFWGATADTAPCVDCTVQFRYAKNASGTAGADMMVIDNLSIVNADGYTVSSFNSFSGGVPSGWTSPKPIAWQSTTQMFQSGLGDNTALRSGNISHNDTSVLAIPAATYPTKARLRFFVRRSCASGDIMQIRRIRSNGTFTQTTVQCAIDAPATTINFPASADSAVAVGASTDHDYRAGFSQFDTLGTGKSVDFLAPSSGGPNRITTTDRTGTGNSTGYTAGSDYTSTFNGTSAATPVAAGIAALMISKNPSLTRAEILTIMRNTSAKIGDRAYVSGKNKEYGYGRLDAHAALVATPSPDPEIEEPPPATPPVIAYEGPYVLRTGAAIADILPASTGSDPTAYSISPALPAGLSFDTPRGIIYGTPTAIAANQTFTIIATNDDGADTATLQLSVVLAPPASLTYLTPAPTYGKNTAITPNTATLGGTTIGVTFALHAGTLPSGLALDTATGALSGTPLAAGVFTPVIRAGNDSGFVLDTMSITVNGFAYVSATATYGKNITITANTTTGVTGTGGIYLASPSLPLGLRLDSATGAITGKPTTQTAQAKYAISRNFTGGTAYDTLTLTVNGFSYATPSANYAQSSAITPNTVGSIVGAGGSFSVSPSLPDGLSLNTSTGEISGTPTSPSSATKYAVTRTFTGADATDTVTIAVNLSAPTSLSYTSSAPTYGKNVSISTNTATVGGTTTGISFALQGGALPTGLSLNTTTGAITGKPTAIGTFEPIIRASNGAGFADDTLTITVEGFSYAATTVTYGIEFAITPNTITEQVGSEASFYTSNPAFPPGIHLDPATGSIIGETDQQSPTTKYAISFETPESISIDTLTMTVNGFSYSGDFLNYTQNQAITPLTVSNVVGTGGSYSVSPPLPDGLSLNASTGEITGTPTTPTEFQGYWISRNFNGASARRLVRMTVSLSAPTSLSYASPTPTYGRNVTIAANNATVGGSTTDLTFELLGGALPTGLSLNTTTGAITGKPTEAGTFEPIIRVSNGAGAVDDTLNITVNGFSYASSTATYGKNITISSNTTTGVTGTGGIYLASPSLPLGLRLDSSTGAITGKPTTQTAQAKYAISRNFTGGTAYDTLAITVNGFSYGTGSATYAQLAAISPNAPAQIVGVGGSYSVSPALPSGLTLNTATGEIAGTPYNTQTQTHYVITRTFSEADAADTITITVLQVGPTELEYEQQTPLLGRNTTIDPIDATIRGGTDNLSFALHSGSLPPGISISTGINKGSLIGTPTAAGTYEAVIRVSNEAGHADDTLTLTVNGFAYATTSNTYTVGTPITPNTPQGVVGTGGQWSATPELPNGLALDATTGVISGTPAALSTQTAYSITRSFDGAPAQETLLISVVDTAPAGLTYPANPARYTKGVGITLNRPVVAGGRSNLAFTVHSGALPEGLNLNPATGSIWGVPATTGSFEAVIRATNSGGFTAVTVNIAVGDSLPQITYGTDTVTVQMFQAVTDIAPVNTGGAVVSWAISPNIATNTGLHFNTYTGRISGTPVYLSPAVNYTITATGFGGVQAQATLVLKTTPQPPVIAYAGPYTFTLKTEIETITPTKSGAPVIAWSISPDLSALTGLRFNTTTGRIFGTPSYLSAATTYTVIATAAGGAHDTATITLETVTPAPTVTYPDTTLTWPVGTPIALFRRTAATGLITGYSIAPTLPAGLMFNATNGAIMGTPAAPTSATTYVITVHGPGGTGSDSVTIATPPNGPSLAFPDSAYTFMMGTAIEPLRPSNSGGPITAWAIRPAANGQTLSANTGLQFNVTTGRISGTPTALTPATAYTVVAIGLAGSRDSAIVTITTAAAAPVLAYPDTTITWITGVTVTPLTRLSVTGIVTSYSISPTLPAGLMFNATTGRISGTPTAISAATPYVIAAHGPGGAGRDTVTIGVAANPPLLAYDQPTRTFTRGVEIEPFRPTNGGGPITGWAISPAANGKTLSANTGLQFNPTTGRIYGTPTIASAPRVYTVTAYGLSGVSDTESVTITVVTPGSKLSAGESRSFFFRVSDAAGGEGSASHIVRIPEVDEATEAIAVSIVTTEGRTVWSTLRDPRTGEGTLTWDGRARNGRPLGAGVYIVRITARGAGRSVEVIEKGVGLLPR